jgi:enamine deaminase RidA (YjgF/YER057c/UK114 family)
MTLHASWGTNPAVLINMTLLTKPEETKREEWMSRVDVKLAELGLEIPEPPPALANYVAAVRTGNLVFVAGHGPRRDGQYVYIGKLGQDLSVEEGYQAARLVILNCLASLKAEIGDLDHVRRIVKLLGMVNSAPGFPEQPAVINGASDLLVDVFAERGRHARSAVGMAELPMGISVEIELVAEVV